MATKPRAKWSEARLNALRWPERATVSEWVDRNILLGGDSAEPGPYHTDRTPYVREWQDSAALPWVHQVTIVKSTQVGGSVALLNVLAYAISEDPGPITWVMPTREDAGEFGENRVAPMVDLSPALRRQMTGERFDAKKRQIKFRRCRVLFRSARVPKELAQYAARWLFGDEAGKWPKWTQGEAAPWDLARERTRTFWNHKVFLNSTPTVSDGLISTEFLRGDRRRFHVPCPHCSKFQVLRWSQVKWPDGLDTEAKMRAAKQAWYECAHCKQRIVDLQKATMLAKGWWCPEDVDPTQHIVDGRLILPNDRTAHRSYHLWAGYSPWLAWWEIVAESLRSKDDPASRQNFVNSWLGEPWEEKVDQVADDAIAACIEPRPMFEAPDEVQVLTAACDVQKDRIEWAVVGWGFDEESWVLAAGRSTDWKDLGETLFYTGFGPRNLKVSCCVVDSRHRRDEVMEFVRRWSPVTRMIAGVERDMPVPFGTLSIDKHPKTGLKLPNSQTVWTVNVGMFKDLVSARLAKAVQTFEAGKEPSPADLRAGRLHLPNNLPEGWLEQLASEHKILERTGIKERMRWVLRPGHHRNEAWDLLVYNAAAARMKRVDTLRSPERQTLQQRQRAAQAMQQQHRPQARRPSLGQRFPLSGGQA